jgi:hypothetical protein
MQRLIPKNALETSKPTETGLDAAGTYNAAPYTENAWGNLKRCGGAVMRIGSLIAAAAALLAAGCTVLHSTDDGTVSGIPYYLPKSMVVAEVMIKKKGANYFLEFVTTGNGKTRGEIVPDQRQRFHLTYNSNIFYNDRYCISTDANNLLQSIEYASEDATPRIALALAALAQKGPQAFAIAAAGEAETVDTIRVTFDPFDWTETKAAEKIITDALPLDARIGSVKFDFAGFVRLSGTPKAACRSDKGVCFRAKLKVPMRLTDRNGGALSQTVYVDMVNVDHIGHFDLDRTFMVEKVVRLGFENGALSQVIMRKPSEVLETVKLPLAIVDTILAVPANFLAKTGGTNATLNTELQQQQATLKILQEQLATGLSGNYDGPYRERCKGSVFNTTP